MNAITEEEAARRRNRAAEYVARHARKCAEYDERKAWLDAEAAKLVAIHAKAHLLRRKT